MLIQISNGDQHAFTMLFDAHSPGLYTFAFKLTRSKLLAEEVIQDVFLNIWLNRTKLLEVENFGGYINRITRNISFNALSKVAKDKVLKDEFIDDENYPDRSTEELLDYNASAALIEKAIAKLSTQQRLVYQLCKQEGLTYEQAAEKLNVAPSTIKSHMKEALKNLRDHLKGMEIPMVIVSLLIR